VELTDAGRVFVEEARSALSHTERAVHFARAAHDGSDSILTIGHSPYANHDWVSAMLCNAPVPLETAKTNEDGAAIHEQCYLLKVKLSEQALLDSAPEKQSHSA
jgi:hypothetical protein